MPLDVEYPTPPPSAETSSTHRCATKAGVRHDPDIDKVAEMLRPRRQREKRLPRHWYKEFKAGDRVEVLATTYCGLVAARGIVVGRFRRMWVVESEEGEQWGAPPSRIRRAD